MSAHTPWFASRSERFEEWYVRTGGNVMVTIQGGTPEEREAIARQIEALPDLLEALQRAERCIRGYTPSAQKECGLDAIRAAIARATGAA